MIKLYIEMCNAELIGRVAQASADIRAMGHEWCETGTTNPAVESMSLNGSRLGLKRLRRKNGGQQNSNIDHPIMSQPGSSRGADPNGNSTSKPQPAKLPGTEPSPYHRSLAGPVSTPYGCMI
jgi:hypothetical protein